MGKPVSCSGNIFGVALNDRHERLALADAFCEPPFLNPPWGPIVYMKPASALGKGLLELGSGERVVAACTLALLFARDAAKCRESEAWDTVGAVALAVDFSLPQADYYRPAIPQMNRDGFLTLGQWQVPTMVEAIALTANEVQHEWQLDRLDRNPARLISDLSEFMTLRAGDILLVGLPGDAPHLDKPTNLVVSGKGHPDLRVSIAGYSA